MADAMTGGGLLVKSLHREGVRCVFALCGQSVSPIFDACLDHGIRILDTRTELAAAYMADAWGRLTRHPGVCVTTGGPGSFTAMIGAGKTTGYDRWVTRKIELPAGWQKLVQKYKNVVPTYAMY